MSSVVDRFHPKHITMVAFVTLPVRCACIVLLMVYWDNPWGFVATQILDGICSGVYDIMLSIIVQKLTVGSGRFGFTFGFVVTCWRIGHGCSILMGESIVYAYGYMVAFSVLGGLGVVNLLGFAAFFSLGDVAK